MAMTVTKMTLNVTLYVICMSCLYVDLFLWQYIEGMDVTPEKDKVAWENLQDNRDVQVILSWDPPVRLVCRPKCQ